MTDDRFALDTSQGGLEEFSGKTITASFIEGDYGLALRLQTLIDDPETAARYEDGLYTQFFSCGKGWRTPDAGSTAVHESGNPRQRFHAGSKIGTLIAALAKVPGIDTYLPADWTATRAECWKGLHLHWGRVEIDARTQEDGQWRTVKKTVLLPVALADGSTPTTDEPESQDAATVLGLSDTDVIGLAVLANETTTGKELLEKIISTRSDLVQNVKFMRQLTQNPDQVRTMLLEETF